ncbi:MAG: universal stress protein [Actinomycetota bacterium]
MFDRILIPLDGSLVASSALVVGEHLADRWDADIKILSLVQAGALSTALDQSVRTQADRIARKRQVDIRDVSYSVVEDIAHEFDEVDDTLVVMSTLARSHGAAVRSNVAEDVMRHIRHPMLLVGPGDELPAGWPSGPFYVCTDGSPFAESIVPTANAWARSLSLEPTVLSVIDDRKVPADIPAAAESNAAARAAKGMEAATGASVQFETLHGPDPAKAIIDFAERNGAAMIAMATHGRSGLHRLMFGSVAMDVVRGATCPVLVDRPSVDIEH